MSQDYFTLITFQNLSQIDSIKPIQVDLDKVHLEN